MQTKSEKKDKKELSDGSSEDFLSDNEGPPQSTKELKLAVRNIVKDPVAEASPKPIPLTRREKPSPFWMEIQKYLGECQKSEDEKRMSLRRSVAPSLTKKDDIAAIQTEAVLVFDSETKDDTKLIELCLRAIAQEKADKNLESIVKKVFRGELAAYRGSADIISQFELETANLVKENQKVRIKNAELQRENDRLNQELADMQQKFGGVLLREINHKDKEAKEKMTQREQVLLQEHQEEINKRENSHFLELEKLRKEIEDYKKAIYEWADKLAKAEEQIHKLETQNKKLLKNNNSVAEQIGGIKSQSTELNLKFYELKTENSSLKIRISQLEGELNSYKSKTEIEERFQDFKLKRQSKRPD